jgi:Ion channel
MKQPKQKFESDEDLADVISGHGPCTYLLLSLLGLILVYPYLREGVFGRISLGILFSLILLGGARAIGQAGAALIVRFALAGLGIALQWAFVLTGDRTVMQLSALTFAAFLVVMIVGVLNYIMKKGPVTADKLHGALAGYIMLALLWAFIYVLTEVSTPGSFAPGAIDLAGPGAFFQLLYFSFTTLTTTGYGDITPATDQARSFVMIEEFAGVFFVGVLIARLAGLYPAKH